MVEKKRLELDNLNFYTPDIHGFTPDPLLIGNILTHTRRGDQFTITGFTWLSATDEWGVQLTKMGEIFMPITIPLSRLPGDRHTGEPRFQECEEYYRYNVSEPVGYAEELNKLPQGGGMATEDSDNNAE